MLLLIFGANLAVFFAAWLVVRRDLTRCVREPILSKPVLIFESDDWSPGGTEQTLALRAIADVLRRFRDQQGRHPQFVLGLILSIPGRMVGGATPGDRYRRITFLDPCMTELRDTIRQGVADGVFSLQLHGMEHFWPAAVLARVARDPELADWLGAEYPQSEALPSELQSRWTDARSLPSSPHPPAAIRAAMDEEITAFREAFGQTPAILVPPTFVWTEEVERAAAAGGVRHLITPGQRFVGRIEGGGLTQERSAGQCSYWNGRRLASGLTAFVRDIYFEPGYGHSVDSVLPRIASHVALGRPVLLETHRFNFITSDATREAHLVVLADLITAVLERWPDTRFLSTEELADAYVEGGSNAIAFERSFPHLASALLARIRGNRLLRRTFAATVVIQIALLFIFALYTRAMA